MAAVALVEILESWRSRYLLDLQQSCRNAQQCESDTFSFYFGEVMNGVHGGSVIHI